MTDSPLRPIRVVSVDDPALDLVAMDQEGVGEYASRRDPSSLVFLPGQESGAFWYTLAPIPNRLFLRFVEEGASWNEKWTRAFVVAIRKVEGYIDPETGDRIHQEWRPGSRTRIPKLNYEVWPDDVLDVVPPLVVQELGKVAYDRCALSGRDVDFLGLPPGLHDRILPRILRAVIRARASRLQATNSDAISSESTGATAPETALGTDHGQSP